MIHIYKASAGSGKTFTLAREYIKYVLGRKDENGRYHLRSHLGAAHRSVLAITFTNKATEEMKSRIIHELAVIAGMERGCSDKSPYADDLCQCFGCTAQALREAAAQALRGLLYDFSFFSVSTIDSFFQTVLRTFAREAEVSGNYDLELDDKAVTALSIDAMLQDINHCADIGPRSHLVAWITAYMTSLVEEGQTFNLFNRNAKLHQSLIDFVYRVSNDTYRDGEQELLAYLADKDKLNRYRTGIHDGIRTLNLDVRRKCGEAVAYIERTGADSNLNRYLLPELKKWAGAGFDPKGPGKTLMKVSESIEEAYKKAGQTSAVRTPELDGLICEATRAILDTYTRGNTLRILAANLYQLGLIGEIAAYVDRYRRENSTILLSDTNKLIAKIIGDDDAPFLYERTGARFSHYLIDEFQDTSLSQWRNLRPLLRESLSRDSDNLVIGDEKQSIYRFRNADSSLLHNLHLDPMARGRCAVSGEAMADNTNWRSSATVVRFNNTFFTFLAAELGLADHYANVAQQVAPRNASREGYVDFRVYAPKPTRREWEEEALDNLTRHLRRQLESGYRPGQIAILIRKGDEGERIIAHLDKVRRDDPGFPYFRIVSDSSMQVGSSGAVSMVISRLRLLSSTEVRTDPRKKTHREVAAMIHRFEALHSKGMEAAAALQEALEPQEMTEIPADPLPGRCADLISLTESIIRENVPPEDRAADCLYLHTFQDLVAEFASRGQGDIRSFLRWWDETGRLKPVAGAYDDSALNIITVHRSKGLEYECVHVPFAQLKGASDNELSWFRLSEVPGLDADVLPPMVPLELSARMEGTIFEEKRREVMALSAIDELNVLYVAFTRAVSELIVGVCHPSSRFPGMAPQMVGALGCSTEERVSEMNARSQAAEEAVPPFIHLAAGPDSCLTLGTPTLPPPTKNAQVSALTPSALLHMEDYSLGPDRRVKAAVDLDEQYYNVEDARDRGILLHDTIARVHRCGDVDKAVLALRHSKRARRLAETDLEEIRDILRNRVEDPRAVRWFDGYKRLLIERTLVVDKEETLRPDRVVWTRDGFVDIIDFKTGVQPPAKYKKQLRGYVDFFRALGYERVRGFLYYLDTGQIIETA